MTYAILKNTCGQFILQDLLEKRQEIADDIEKQVDQYVIEWGVDVRMVVFRSRKFSSRIFSSARTCRIRSPARPRNADWPRARSSRQRQTWNQLN